MNFIEFIGLAAAILTAVSFFPQVVKTIKTKSTADISLPMYLLMFTATICWLVYGILISNTPIILTNSLSSISSFIIFFYKMRDIIKLRKQ